MQPDTRGARNDRERERETRRHTHRERAHKARADLFYFCCCCCCVIMCAPNQTTSPNEIQTRTDKTFEDTPAVCLPCGSGSANEFSLHCTLALACSLNIMHTYVKCIKVFCQLATLGPALAVCRAHRF